MIKKNAHIGSTFDSFLEDQGLLAEAEAAAIKRVVAHQLKAELELAGMSKSTLAAAMETSRAAVDRLLDTDNTSVTLATLAKAAIAVGRQLSISLVSRASLPEGVMRPLVVSPPRAWPAKLAGSSSRLPGDDWQRSNAPVDEGMAVAA